MPSLPKPAPRRAQPTTLTAEPPITPTTIPAVKEPTPAPPVPQHQGKRQSEPPAKQGPDTAFKVICKQEDLARSLAVVWAGVLERSTMPILQNVLLSTDQGRLRISSTNLEIGVQVWLDADIVGEGTIVVHADRFRKLVRTLPREKVTLSIPAGSQTITIACPGSKTNFRSVGDSREFPMLPSFGEEHAHFVLPAATLKSMIFQVGFAADADLQNKAALASIKMTIEDGAITLVAADTVRLCERIHPLQRDAQSEGAVDILVPATNMEKLATILPAQGDVTILVIDKKHVVFHLEQGERIDVSSRLVAGRYMNYKKAIPQQHLTRAVVDVKRLQLAAEGASMFAVDTTKSMRFTFAPQEESNGTLFGSVTVDADDASLGDSVAVLDAEVTGPRQVIFFHATFLREALEHIDSPQVSFEINETGRPVLLKPVGEIQYTQLLQTQTTKKTSV